MQKLTCPRGGAAHLTFSPNGDILTGLGPVASPPALGAAPTAVYCWTRSRDWECTGLERTGILTGIAFHPTGRTLAYAAITQVWLYQAPPPPPPPGAPPPSLLRRRFAKQTPRPFTGVHLYPLTGVDEVVPNRLGVPQPENRPVQVESWARGLAFTPDGRVLLSAQIESVGFTGSRTNVYHWHFTETDGVWQAVNTVATVGATERGGALVGDCLVLAGAWGVAVCPVAPPTELYVPDVSTASAVAVAPRGELVATCDRGSVAAWHLRAHGPIRRARIGPDGVSALAFAPDGAALAIGTTGKGVTFWNPHTDECEPERDFGVGPVTGLAYAPDGLTLAVAGRTGVVVVDTE